MSARWPTVLVRRRQRLPWELFVDLLRRVLRPRAPAASDAFGTTGGLVALDGTQFSFDEHAASVGTFVKSRTRRGRAAFAKLTTASCSKWVAQSLAAGIGTPANRSGLGQRLLADLRASPAVAVASWRAGFSSTR